MHFEFYPYGTTGSRVMTPFLKRAPVLLSKKSNPGIFFAISPKTSDAIWMKFETQADF